MILVLRVKEEINVVNVKVGKFCEISLKIKEIMHVWEDVIISHIV